jgi:hypothetical protein
MYLSNDQTIRKSIKKGETYVIEIASPAGVEAGACAGRGRQGRQQRERNARSGRPTGLGSILSTQRRMH